jgi:hypothetical protein
MKICNYQGLTEYMHNSLLVQFCLQKYVYKDEGVDSQAPLKSFKDRSSLQILSYAKFLTKTVEMV